MHADDIRAFVRRDWARLERAKAASWQALVRDRTAAERLALGDSLRRFAQAQRPGWPTVEDRAEDLKVHVRVSEALRAVRAVSR